MKLKEKTAFSFPQILPQFCSDYSLDSYVQIQPYYSETVVSNSNGENTMATVAVTTNNQYEQERYHLTRRLNDLYYEKDRALEKAFGLRDDDPPRTVKDMVERIKTGKFIPPKDRDDNDDFDAPFYNIRWRDPELKEDRKGYDAAYDLLKKARNNTKDEILIKTPTEGLDALRAFEAQTFH